MEKTHKRKRGHKGNNGLIGKPSNNKGKKRAEKLPRRSTLDIEIAKDKEKNSSKEDDQDSDVEENLDHIPITVHMYRSAFIKKWCSKLQPQVVHEDMLLHEVLGHDITITTPCIINLSETPTCHTVDHWRKGIKVKGKEYTVPEVKRAGDRNVRDYHFWMYNSGLFTRQELAQMVSPKNVKDDKGENFGGSHICGGNCLNHARPEANTVNQERKPHHRKLREALEKNKIDVYKYIRAGCNHDPKCFVNPGRLGLTDALISANRDEYNLVLQTYQ